MSKGNANPFAEKPSEADIKINELNNEIEKMNALNNDIIKKNQELELIKSILP